MAYSAPFTYSENSPSAGKCTITLIDNAVGDLVIPATLGGFEVAVIGDNAGENKGITSLTFNNSIYLTSVGTSSFKDNSISDLTIPSTLTVIGYMTFANNNISTLVLNADIAEGASESFSNCGIGNGLTIGSSVTIIPSLIFKDAGLTSVTFPASVTEIGYQSFEGNSISDLTIPSTLTEIGSYAFRNNDINTLVLNSTVSSSNSAPFYGCSIGSGLTIGNSVITIAAVLFDSSGLTSVTFPSSVASVGAGAFQNNSITNLTIPSTLITIGNYAFRYNDTMTTLVLNATVISSNSSPFFGCDIGAGLTIGNSVTTIAADLFMSSGLTGVTFPIGLVEIKANAFRDNSILAIDLPEAVTTVGESAFQDNLRLASVTVNNNSITFTSGDTTLTNNMIPRLDRIVPCLENSPECVLLASDGSVYVGEYAGGRLLGWNESTDTFDVLAVKYGTVSSIYSLCELNGDIYGAGTTGRLLVMTPSGWQSVAPPNGLTTIMSLSILNDCIYAVGTGTNGLLEWNGIDAWNKIVLGSATSIASCEHEGEIYIEGGTGSLYKWVGTTFVLVALRYVTEKIVGLLSFGGTIYAKYRDSGAFVKLNDTADGWDLIGTASTGSVSRIATDGTYLYFHVWNVGTYRSTGEIGNLTQITSNGFYSIKDLIYKNGLIYALDASAVGGLYEVAFGKGIIYANDPSNAKTWWTDYWTEDYDFVALTLGWVKKWDGSNWVIIPPKKWDGSSWVNCSIKRWNGANWV